MISGIPSAAESRIMRPARWTGRSIEALGGGRPEGRAECRAARMAARESGRGRKNVAVQHIRWYAIGSGFGGGRPTGAVIGARHPWLPFRQQVCHSHDGWLLGVIVGCKAAWRGPTRSALESRLHIRSLLHNLVAALDDFPTGARSRQLPGGVLPRCRPAPGRIAMPSRLRQAAAPPGNGLCNAPFGATPVPGRA